MPINECLSQCSGLFGERLGTDYMAVVHGGFECGKLASAGRVLFVNQLGGIYAPDLCAPRSVQLHAIFGSTPAHRSSP
jgi:hypothetical protein